MIVKIKGIYHERTEDAPFMGALICANDCQFNCHDCFNQELKNTPSRDMDSKEIINIVKSNEFNKGIVLAGLEWTLQPKEMFELINVALEEDLKVILYTGRELKELQYKFPLLFTLPIYIKYGRYDNKLKTISNEVFGVNLASSNQNIIKVGGLL